MSLQVDLLEQSFNYIRPYGSLFVSDFYKNLFKTHPEIKSLFNNIDLETAKNKFWLDLTFIVDNLRRFNILDNFLRGLGARLFTYGTLPKDYLLVEEPFLTTFAQFLGDEWTVEFKDAWSNAYRFFRKLMLQGANQASQQMGLPDSALNIKESQEEQVETFSSNSNSLVEVMTNPSSELKNTLEQTVEASSDTNNYLEKSIENLIPQEKNTLKEEATMGTESNNSSLKDLENIDTVPNADSSIVPETPIAISEDIHKIKSEETTDNNALIENIWVTPAPEIENIIGNDDNSLEEILESPLTELEDISTEKVESISSIKTSPTNEFDNLSIAPGEETIPQLEIETVEDIDNSLEEILNTPIPDLKDIAKDELEVLGNAATSFPNDLTNNSIPQWEESSESQIEAIANIDNYTEPIDKSLEEILTTEISNLEEETLEESVEMISNQENSLEESLDASLSENSVTEKFNLAEQQVTIKEDIKDFPETNIPQDTFEITMTESNTNIPENDLTLEQLDKPDNSLEETNLETPLADLPENPESKSVDPHFTQIFSPEPQSRTEKELSSTATATLVKPVASERKYQPQSQTSQSNKGLLIGGGVAGGIGLLLLLLL